MRCTAINQPVAPRPAAVQIRRIDVASTGLGSTVLRIVLRLRGVAPIARRSSAASTGAARKLMDQPTAARKVDQINEDSALSLSMMRVL
jgi:hypothetical protein